MQLWSMGAYGNYACVVVCPGGQLWSMGAYGNYACIVCLGGSDRVVVDQNVVAVPLPAISLRGSAPGIFMHAACVLVQPKRHYGNHSKDM